MALSTTAANALLLNWLNGTALPAWITATTGYLTLHTADPGDAGVQTANELSVTGVTRLAVTKSGTGGWTVSGKGAVNTASLTFGPKTAGTDATATHVSFGELATGAGAIFVRGPLTPTVLVQNATSVQLPATTGVVWTIT